MDDAVETLRDIYDRFNSREIDGVLAALADDVAWANGMEGGHVHGREAVRAYWSHQWAIVSPHVEPLSFDHAGDGTTVVLVRQSVGDLEGRLLVEQTHGLESKTVHHVFHFAAGKIARFDIQDAT